MVEDALEPLSDFVAEDAPVPMVDEDSPCLAEEPPVPMEEELDCAYANVAVPASSVAASAARRTCLKVIYVSCLWMMVRRRAPSSRRPHAYAGLNVRSVTLFRSVRCRGRRRIAAVAHLVVREHGAAAG
jgi:hypothetical protein